MKIFIDEAAPGLFSKIHLQKIGMILLCMKGRRVCQTDGATFHWEQPNQTINKVVFLYLQDYEIVSFQEGVFNS